jgi:hypothetical protein
VGFLDYWDQSPDLSIASQRYCAGLMLLLFWKRHYAKYASETCRKKVKNNTCANSRPGDKINMMM